MSGLRERKKLATRTALRDAAMALTRASLLAGAHADEDEDEDDDDSGNGER